MFMQTPQIDSLKGKHTNLSLAFHTPKWSPCPSWSSSEMTFFLRYKCRIQWYFEPCARAPDSHSLQLCPLFFLTSTYQKCPFNLHLLVILILSPSERRSTRAAGSTPGTPALSQIRSLAFRRAAGLGERLLLLAQDLPSEVTEDNTIPAYNRRFRYERCGVASVPMPFMWSSGPRALEGRVGRWHNLSLIGIRCIRISAAKQRTE